MRITKRQLRRIIKEELGGTDWKASTRAVTGDTGDRGAEKNIEFDLGRINELVPKLMADYADGVDDDKMSALYIYIEDVRSKLESGKWSDF